LTGEEKGDDAVSRYVDRIVATIHEAE